MLEYAGLRLLTDPTFDPPGRQESGLTKLTPPALSAEEVGPIDARRSTARRAASP